MVVGWAQLCPCHTIEQRARCGHFSRARLRWPVALPIRCGGFFDRRSWRSRDVDTVRIVDHFWK